MSFTLMTALGFFIIFAMSTLGSAVVYFFKDKEIKKAHTLFLGFASGIMIAASVWSLLLPAMEEAQSTFGNFSWLPVSVGFVLGGLFLVLLDKVWKAIKSFPMWVGHLVYLRQDHPVRKLVINAVIKEKYFGFFVEKNL